MRSQNLPQYLHVAQSVLEGQGESIRCQNHPGGLRGCGRVVGVDRNDHRIRLLRLAGIGNGLDFRHKLTIQPGHLQPGCAHRSHVICPDIDHRYVFADAREICPVNTAHVARTHNRKTHDTSPVLNIQCF